MIEPPLRCPQHADDPAPHPCGACADAREFHAEWDRTRRLEAAQNASTAARAKAELRRLDIAQCHLCDAAGYYNGRPCTHDPLANVRAERGIAACREALQ
jgi:hypothetical protein